MKFTIEHIQSGSTEINLLRYDRFDPFEELDKLTQTELERFHTFSHLNRKREFVATRILRHHLFGFEHIHYNEFGAPYIESEGFISVSHCKGLVGIALNASFQVGLDLEIPRDQIQSLGHKFLSEHERQTFNTADNLILTKIWSAKEALYKLAGRKQIIFKNELLLEEKDGDYWKGRIINPDHEREVKLHIFDHNDLVITINAEEIRIV